MIFDVVAGIGRICEEGLGVSLFLSPPSLSLCVSLISTARLNDGVIWVTSDLGQAQT